MTIFAFFPHLNKYTTPLAHNYHRFSAEVSNAAHFSLNFSTNSHTPSTASLASKTLNYHSLQICDYSEVSETWSLNLSSRQHVQSGHVPSPYQPWSVESLLSSRSFPSLMLWKNLAMLGVSILWEARTNQHSVKCFIRAIVWEQSWIVFSLFFGFNFLESNVSSLVRWLWCQVSWSHSEWHLSLIGLL